MMTRRLALTNDWISARVCITTTITAQTNSKLFKMCCIFIE